MHLQLNNHHMANEVLYALDAVRNSSVGHLSRLTLQKVLYLSGALAPLKDIVLEFLRFNADIFGPYKGDIQNSVDHLVGIGLVDIIYFQRTGRRGTRPAGVLSHYKISDTGKEVINRLIKYPHEEEKAWWITLVTSLTYSYLVADGLAGSVDDKIKSIVYQDPTYATYKKKNLFKVLIDLSDTGGLTYQLSNFLKNYVQDRMVITSDITERKKVEILLVTFMEYLYTGVLNDASQGSSKAQ